MGQLIGLDVGYGFVKVTDGKVGYSFPSVVGDGKASPTLRTKPQQLQTVDDLRLEVNNQVYFVGKSAIRHSNFVYRDLSAARKEGNDLEILFLSALSLFCSNFQNKFKVLTGLPAGRMYLADELVNQVQNKRNIKIYHNNKQRDVEIQVEHVEIVPQPLGTYWSQYLDTWGQPKHSLEGRTGIIDIGFRTTDLAVIEDGDYIPEKSKTLSLGMSNVYSEIRDNILSNYGLERETHSLDGAVITGKINIAGKEVDISPIIDDAFKKLATNLLVEINSTWLIPEFDLLLISGGGGQALSPYLLPNFTQAKLVTEPVTANSRGYEAWANRLWGVNKTKDSGEDKNEKNGDND
ncbi:MAG: ParM/StbA family protein [Clostridiales bacterium]|nr:ParM/StbA family protein [Clostridiales bacterium]MCF8023680.1 ParM/StbA family protein [Clostridiales bacterium]